MTPIRIALAAGIAAILLPTPASAADAVGWRMGTHGRFPDARPPITWSATENVVWETALPTPSNASPVLLEKASRLFVLSEPDLILALDAADGSVVWSDSTRDLTSDRPDAHRANGWATPTPVTDGRRVFAVFGSGAVAAYSVDGERLWARTVQRPRHGWGHSASPALVGDRLIVHFIDLFALDPATGDEVWRAKSEPKWGSPVAARVGNADLVVTPSGDVFAAADGRRIASDIGELDHATPVVSDGVIYFIEKRATAVRLPATLEGPFETLWRTRVAGWRHYASALVHDGLVYAFSREEKLSILDAATGEVLVEKRLKLDSGLNTAYPSIALAGDKIFVSTENGTTVVLEPGPVYRELGRNSIEGFRSSPIFAGTRMYVRTFGRVYCFGS